MALLELRDVHSAYGNVQALKGISMHVEAGEIVTLLGANGAGLTPRNISPCMLTAIRSKQKNSLTTS